MTMRAFLFTALSYQELTNFADSGMFDPLIIDHGWPKGEPARFCPSTSGRWTHPMKFT